MKKEKKFNFFCDREEVNNNVLGSENNNPNSKNSCQILIECKPSETDGVLNLDFYYDGDEDVVAFAIQKASEYMNH